jgi:hypothetical protein
MVVLARIETGGPGSIVAGRPFVDLIRTINSDILAGVSSFADKRGIRRRGFSRTSVWPPLSLPDDGSC